MNNKKLNEIQKLKNEIDFLKREKEKYIKAEEKFLHSQRIDTLGQLAGGIVHDYNNMLTTILGTTELLVEDNKENSSVKEYSELIIETVKRLSDTTKKLLMFSKRSKIKIVPTEIHYSIDTIIKMLEKTIDKRVSFQFYANADNSVINVDIANFQNIFFNLAINSRDSMLNGGKIIVETDNIKLENNYFDDFKIEPGEFLKISFKDNGPGISKEIQDHIFEAFYTTKENGTGLGLSTIYNTVKEFKGAIRFNKEFKNGTEFELFFPLAESCITNTKVKEKIYYGKGNILLVDDEEVLRNVSEKMLINIGYNVFLAGNPKQAIDIFNLKKKEIDIVIIDINLPDKNGFELLKSLKKIDNNIKYIFTTGSDKYQFNEGYKCIMKPYNLSELSFFIYKTLNS